MKTPHRITLVRGDTVPKYNPETDMSKWKGKLRKWRA